MNSLNLCRAINEIDDDMISEADVAYVYRRKPKRILMSAAAVFVILVCGTLFYVKLIYPEMQLSHGGNFPNNVFENKNIVYVGEEFSDTEIKKIVEENKESIIDIVNAEYGFRDETIAVCINGYCHVECGNENIIKLDALTLPILVNGEIVANMEIVKNNGEIVSTVNIGGDKWEIYNKVLKENSPNKVVFAFLGETAGEFLILPDNSTVSVTQNPDSALSTDVDWYSLLKTDYNSLSLSDLNDPEKLIVLDEKISVNTQLNEQMGIGAKQVNEDEKNDILSLLNELQLCSGEKPSNGDFPCGGGIVLYCRNDGSFEEKYIFYSKDIIEYGGKYYKDLSDSYDKLISLLCDILYNE